MKKQAREDWVEVAATGRDEEATIIAGSLKAAGIPSIVEGPVSTPLPENLGTFGLSKVMVPPEREAEARRLLERRPRGEEDGAGEKDRGE
ncbi:MAG: putative signal transducing protein [Thermoanaerobaculia bacterium]